jgi:hypothetical protein
VKLSYLALFAVLFLDQRGIEKTPAPASAPVDLAVVAAPTDALAPAVVEAPAGKEERVASIPELPADMRIVVTSKAGRSMLTLVRPGHLVTLVQGEQRVFGDNSASLSVTAGAPILWETSERKAFETLRGAVEWDGRLEALKSARLRTTALLSQVGETSSARHDCKAFDGTKGSITVICRVDSLAVGAARVFADKPQQGINTTMSGEKSFFRMELDAGADGTDAVVLGYSDGAHGHVIRAESSKLPGEKAPSFALLSTARAQPMPIRRFRHPHRFPPHDPIFF